jgi:hypothetical protein
MARASRRRSSASDTSDAEITNKQAKPIDILPPPELQSYVRTDAHEGYRSRRCRLHSSGANEGGVKASFAKGGGRQEARTPDLCVAKAPVRTRYPVDPTRNTRRKMIAASWRGCAVPFKSTDNARGMRFNAAMPHETPQSTYRCGSADWSHSKRSIRFAGSSRARMPRAH